MANTKISALTSATTPLAGTEVLPIVQSSATVKVAVSDLTAGRSVSATSFVPSGSSIPTNGLYLPAANSVGIAANSTNAIYVNSSQQVGIGTSSLTTKFAVNGGTSTSQIRWNVSNATYVEDVSTNAAASAYVFKQSDASYHTWKVSGATVATIDTNGSFLVTGSGTGSLGYGTGAGGSVTQGTSRTTAVTINKPTGRITMFTAAGSPVPSQFTVNNSLVAATDTIVLSIASGPANYYILVIGSVGAGSFNINFWTSGGVTSDTPVINFTIIKGVIA